MEIKNKHVAVAYDDNGKCEFVAKVKVINDRELNRLINEKSEKDAIKRQKELELKKQVVTNQEKISDIESKFVLLAKSIYDNFVDRGLIENDYDFQESYYDFIFNDKEIDWEKAPQEFKTILRKVVGENENQ